MYKFAVVLTLSAVLSAGESTHLRSLSNRLTAASSEPPGVIAAEFVKKAAETDGLTASDIASLYIVKEYRTARNGITHILFRQHFDGVEVYNASWKVNVDADGHVINAGGTFARKPLFAAPAIASGMRAVRAAVMDVNPALDGSYLPAVPTKNDKYVKFARGGFANTLDAKPVWYWMSTGLRPAWAIQVPDENARDSYAVVVDALTQRVLSRRNLTRYQQPQPPAKGLVFERESPQPNPKPGTLSQNPRPYVERTLQPFTGDATASPAGWVGGTETAGNNVYAGNNPLGRFQITNPQPALAPDRNFSFPLQLGPGAPNPTNFADAVTTNLFYWANKAHDLFYSIGFDEPAGNYQKDNFGRGGVDGDPIIASSQYGIARSGIAAVDNAFYSANRDFEDGSRATINMYLSDSPDERTFTDGSLDAQVILHEYTHGVSGRLVQDLDTLQGRAMGEAWSDFYAIEFTTPAGAPPEGAYTEGEYFVQEFGLGVRSHPYSTDLNINPLTYREFGRTSGVGPEEHFDGEIWMSALWEARMNLIRQFGDKEGRRRMALLVMDGMKLAPPSPSMVDARDAILLADQVGFKGESSQQLWAAFAKRGLGAVAASRDANTVTVTPSFETPSNAGVVRLDQSAYTIGEEVRVILNDANRTDDTAQVQLTTSSGDLENLVVRRKEGETFVGTIRTAGDGVQDKFDSHLDAIPGDYISAYYMDYETGSGAKLVETTSPIAPQYSFLPQRPGPPFISGQERSVFTIASGTRVLLSSSRPVALPFAFPFFDRTHRMMYVSPNGLITFDVPAFAGCNDPQSVSRMTAVAPMFMDLVYGGRAQSNENVYISSDAGSMTVRWAAETAATGDPVNFSLVLFSDGRILFQYGSGNSNLVNASGFGCSTSTPFIGVSKGSEGFVQGFEDYMGLPDLGNVPSVVVDPPYGYSDFPSLRLESPEAGGKYQGILTIRGIAYDVNDQIASLYIRIDGKPIGTAMPTLRRDDVCGTEQLPGCPLVGFQVDVEFSFLRLSPGEHTFQIRATNTRGATKDYPEQPLVFAIESGQSRVPVGAIETPVEGAEISGTNASVRGWAYAPDLRVSSVDVIIDGVTYGQAAYGQRRDDICAAITGSRPPNCPNVGFTFTLNTASGRIQLPNGPHLLQVRVRDEAGRYTLIPDNPVRISVTNESNQAPTGVITSPEPNSHVKGILKIWGWAWDPDGRIAAADLVVDGVGFQSLTYGADRAEQCAAIPDAPAACPNVGFEGDFDTRILSNGLHRVGVRLRDNQGRTVIIPRITDSGMDVFIEN